VVGLFPLCLLVYLEVLAFMDLRQEVLVGVGPPNLHEVSLLQEFASDQLVALELVVQVERLEALLVETHSFKCYRALSSQQYLLVALRTVKLPTARIQDIELPLQRVGRTS